MIFSDLPTPAEALIHTIRTELGASRRRETAAHLSPPCSSAACTNSGHDGVRREDHAAISRKVVAAGIRIGQGRMATALCSRRISLCGSAFRIRTAIPYTAAPASTANGIPGAPGIILMTAKAVSAQTAAAAKRRTSDKIVVGQSRCRLRYQTVAIATEAWISARAVAAAIVPKIGIRVTPAAITSKAATPPVRNTKRVRSRASMYVNATEDEAVMAAPHSSMTAAGTAPTNS